MVFTSIGQDLNIVLDSRATVIHESATVPPLHKQTLAIRTASTANVCELFMYMIGFSFEMKSTR